MGAAVGVLAIIAVVAALYPARAFVVPLLIGILASYALRPVVEWLKAIRVPRPAGTALVLAVLVGSSSWTAFSLSDQAAAMIERLPKAARISGPTALQNMQEAANEILFGLGMGSASVANGGYETLIANQGQPRRRSRP